jgi:hypothetical protein
MQPEEGCKIWPTGLFLYEEEYADLVENVLTRFEQSK